MDHLCPDLYCRSLCEVDFSKLAVGRVHYAWTTPALQNQ